MRFHTVDYRKDRPHDPSLVHRGAWLFGVPRVVLLCRLFGHRPIVDGTKDDALSTRYRWVACDRCGIRPEPQGSPDPAQWTIGQRYTGEYLTRTIPPQARKQLAERGHTARLNLPGPWPAHPTSTIGGELVIGRQATFGAGLKLGNVGSEQVLAADFGLPGLFHLYLHTEHHGQFLQRRLNPTSYQSRVIDITAHHGRLWWELWARRDEQAKTDPWWMHGSLRIDPRTILLGEIRHTYTDVGDRIEATVRMPEGDDHTVTLQLQKRTTGRKHGRKTTHWTVDWDAPAGIPFRNDSWKGDNIYGSGVDITHVAVDNGRWVAEACAQIAAQCTSDRSRYHYLPADTEPSTT